MINVVLKNILGADPSKKMIVALVGVILVVLSPKLGITDDLIDKALNLLMIWMGGQVVVDTAKAVKAPNA